MWFLQRIDQDIPNRAAKSASRSCVSASTIAPDANALGSIFSFVYAC